MDEYKYYYLDLSAINCIVQCKINRLPVYYLNAKFGTNFAKPINEVLIGKNNVLEIELFPFLENITEHNMVPDYYVKGAIKIHVKGDISAPDTGEEIIKINIENQPFSKIYFNNETFSFKEIMLETVGFRDENKIKEYGIKLLNLLEGNKTEDLLEEFAPKFVDHAIAYYKEYDNLNEEFKEFIKTNYYPNSPITDIKKEQIFLQSFADNKFWQIRVFPNEMLFRTEPDIENDVYSMDIFVGMYKGDLKVLR
jgi:hypothetical protein